MQEIIEGFRLSPQQRRLWQLQQTDRDSIYRAICQVMIEGSLDINVLEQSIHSLIRQHEILRTSFHSLPGMTYPLQVLSEAAHWSLERLDLSDADGNQQERADALILDFEKEPLTHQKLPLRGAIIKLAPNGHLLIISLPALCADSSSIKNLIQEICQAYDSHFSREQRPHQTMQYADLSEWQNDLLESEETDAGRVYWRSLDLSELETFKLPFDRSPEGDGRFQIGSISQALNHEQTVALQQLALKYDTTILAVTLACWQVLLWRLSGHLAVVVGVLYEGRKYEELRQALGLFAKYLPISCHLREDMTFAEVVSLTNKKVAGAFEWQECFSWELVPTLNVRENHQKYIPITFEYENEIEGRRVAGVSFKLLKGYAQTDRYDLQLRCEDGRSAINFSIRYADNKYACDQIRRMLSQYVKLIQSASEQCDRSIVELDIVPQEERELLLEGFSGAELQFDKIRRTHELIEEQVERVPDKVAIVYQDQHVSYSGLNRGADDLARRLRANGTQVEDLVGICMERSVGMIIAIIGALKSGAAYVPIDPEYPAERVNYILDDMGAKVVVVGKAGEADKVSRNGVEVVTLEERGLERGNGPGAPREGTAENLAYVIYTSGSTGKPKGALITHHNLVHSTTARIHYYSELVESYLLLSSFAFDSSVAGILGTLCRGGKLVLPQEKAQQDVVQIIRLISDLQISHILCLPSLYSILLSHAQVDELSSLQTVIVAGERCPEEMVALHYKLLPHAGLYNEYGPTEATVWSSVYKCQGQKSPSRVYIGSPIFNTRIHALSGRMTLSPIDVPGEIYIGGAGVSRGYLNRPELTAEKFIPNLFGKDPGSRLYKTGDLALYRGDGNIEFLGRADHQVKIRGYRIELGEIESALEQHPSVRESIVLAREDRAGDKRIVAYVIPHKGAEASAKELRAYAREKLPEYMVPTTYVTMKQWPLSPNGKPDRKDLPPPEQIGGETDAVYERPSTPSEEVIAAIWSQVLGVERIGLHDDFFDLGGHSLLATQINSRLRQTFKIDVPLRRLFETPTVGGLATSIERALKEERGLQDLEIARVTRDQDLPLSFAQTRLWFLDKLDPDSFFYNCPAALRLRGPLNIAALTQTINEIVRRHEVLRTSFPQIDGLPVQNVRRHEVFALPLTDLSQLTEAGREIEARRVAREEAQRPFKLEEGPVFRVNIIKVGEDDHLVLFTIHHIVSDEWSIGILIKEIAALYQAFIQGEGSPLSELPIQYADYAVWQRDWLDGAVLNAQLAYWERQLADAPVLKVATSRPRGTFQIYRAASQTVVTHEPLYDAIKKLGRGEGATLFMVLLAAIQTLLHRYTSQEDVVVGTIIANRNRAEIEELVGFFVNTLVLRTDLSGSPGFIELLGRVREMTLGAYANQDLPFERLVETLQPERDLSHTPLFQVMFQLQNTEERFLELPGLTLSYPEAEVRTGKYDLLISLNDTGSNLIGSIQYNAELFDAETIVRMVEHLKLLLEAITADPAGRISDLPMLTGRERDQLMVEWNATEFDHLLGHCIHHLIERQVSDSPDGVAVIFEDACLTYRELNARANRLAYYLMSKGVGPGTSVAVCLERSAEMLVALLGVLKAGGAYAPLDPAYPKQRLAFMLEDTRASIVLTQNSLVQIIALGDAQIICVDDKTEDLSGFVDDNPITEVCAENIAYIIYTSGSTGRPKGVMISHAAICNRLLWMQNKYPLGGDDSLLHKTPISFDASVWELFVPLMAGARLVMARPGGHQDSAYLVEAIAENQITVLQLVPSMLAVFLEEPGVAACLSLKRMFCGGEALSPELQEQFYRLMDADLFILYGPTETSIDAASWACRCGEYGPFIPLGNPISNIRIYLLSAWLQPVPLEMSGDLDIAGAGLAQGYLNRPELTAERFIPDPFSDLPGARLYKSGDLARYLPDGTLTYLGRSDEQIKVRGFRIELGEIEAVLNRHPKVRQSTALAREDGAGQKCLVAYVVAATGSNSNQTIKPNAQAEVLSVGELRSYLKDNLPEYMIPSAFVMLSDMPLTPNGKLDRKALPAPGSLNGDGDSQSIGPRTHTQEIIAAIWSQVLGVDRVGAHDDFFEMGGHSLRAIQINSRLRQAFQVEVSLRRFFEGPTVAKLAEEIERRIKAERPADHLEITRVSRDQQIPLSFAQQRLWFLDQLDPGNPSYNLPMIIHIDGPLRIEILERSFNEVARRHEVLRTSFLVHDGQPYQVIHPATEFKLEVIDLTKSPATDRQAEIMQSAVTDARIGFDLENGPLYRLRVVKEGEEEHALLLTMHHIISDAWSMSVLVEEVAALYEAFAQGKPPPLEELPIQYADYAYWQRGRLESEVVRRQIEYWKKQLRGGEFALELPTDRPRPAVQSYRGAVEGFEVAPEVSEKLKTLAREQGATSYMALLGAFYVLLSRYSGQQDLCIGSPIAGRTRKEVEGLVGIFINTLVMRVRGEARDSFEELLMKVKEAAISAYANEEAPFERIVEEVGVERDVSRSPLFQVMFGLQNTPHSELKIKGLRLSSSAIDSGTARFDVNVEMTEMDEGLAGSLNYNSDLFDPGTIKRLIAHFKNLLESITANPQEAIEKLPLLSKQEREQMLYEWNDTRARYEPGQCLHEIFERQVEQFPEAVALSFDDQALSYGEINSAANRLAHLLIKSGAGPESLIGVFMHRSIEMVVGLLAVLKSGAAYAPLDPSYPKSRLDYMINDAGAHLLLTRQGLAERLADCDAKVIELDGTRPAGSGYSEENPAVKLDGENLAYMIYTSGSTGQPKGVLIPHRGIYNRLMWMQENYPLTASDRLLQKTPISFDASVWELFLPLMSGARLVIARPGGHQDSNYLVKAIADEEISVLQLVPTMLQVLLSERSVGGCKSLRRVYSGGEALSGEVEENYFARVGKELINLYGPTESSIDATSYYCAPGIKATTVPIGKPIGNVQVYILDQAGDPVAIGVPGEIHIGGTGLARGYHTRLGLTAERFIPHRFAPAPGERLYRTGDLGRYKEDGNIEFLGRKDEQIKLRGFRIELGEIESAIAEDSQIKRVIALVREDQPGDKRIVAYVEWEAQTQMQGEDLRLELRKRLKEKLPEYMLPSAIVITHHWPLTPSGKIDKKLLPAPENTRAESEAPYVGPRTPTEELIAAIWSQVVGVEQVGIYDNFFDLGGNSLLVIQVISQIKEAFRIDIPLRSVFAGPTVAELAQAVASFEVKPGQTEKIASLVMRVKNMSGDDVQEMIQHRKSKAER